ncbi:DedA family protein [Aeromicrobium wangtongii]|uniref:DedA family protein n=1 Tax=Aeromicrobium wangtongii TaxID=2969247 RepID=UPI002016B996|nr:VTT domain-containing protein [Aeromicrobium wangtongii]MCL3820360.1 VTT domain-containing protein [Aeromicrobium wangtongii]
MTRVILGFLFALAESGLGLGAVVPGEVAISGLAAGLDAPMALLVLGAAVAAGAVAGDHIGLVVGRLGGGRLRESRLIHRLGIDRWDKAAGLMQRHGFWAVLASRLLPVVRTVMPVVAGAAGLQYRLFLAASVIGAAGWSAVWVGAGAGIGASGVLDHPWIIAGLAVVAALVIGVRQVLKRRARRRATDPAVVLTYQDA